MVGSLEIIKKKYRKLTEDIVLLYNHTYYIEKR